MAASVSVRRQRTSIVLLFGTAALIAPSLAIAQSAPGDEPLWPHVRAWQPRLALIVEEGCLRSPTLRQLVDAIDQTDVIVHLEQLPLRVQAGGYLQFAGATAKNRYLRVTVGTSGGGDWLIALIAHELQHALEVAAEVRVRDKRSFEDLYNRIGERSGQRFDTEAARRVMLVVEDELEASADASSDEGRGSTFNPPR